MMKATKLITLGALLGTCSFAAAQEQPPRQGRPPRELPAALIKKFDKDGDGKLSDEERKAMQDEMKSASEARKAEMLKKYDKDSDGKLDETERATMKTEMEARHKELLEKYDADKNGKLDPEEVKAARDAGEEIPMGRGPRGPRLGPASPPPAPPAE